MSTRQRELLRWLVLASWGPPLEVSVVCDALWPGCDGDAARSNFSSAVRRLRLALHDSAAVWVSAGTVGLDARRCCSDLDVLHHLADREDWPCSAADAASMATRLLAACRGYNPVLLQPSVHADMALRVSLVGVAWRQVCLRIADALHQDHRASLILALCAGIEKNGLADNRIMDRWHRMARQVARVANVQSEAQPVTLAGA